MFNGLRTRITREGIENSDLRRKCGNCSIGRSSNRTKYVLSAKSNSRRIQTSCWITSIPKVWEEGGEIHIPRCLLLGSPLLEPREKRGTPSFYTANLRTIRGSVQHPDLGHPSCDTVNCLILQTNGMHNSPVHFAYGLFGPNSNTAINEIFLSCGINLGLTWSGNGQNSGPGFSNMTPQ